MGSWRFSQAREVVVVCPRTAGCDVRSAKRLANNAVDDVYLAASPDGKKIAFCSGDAVDRDIRIYDNAASSNTLFSNMTGENTFPAFSPDSKTIAWVNINGGTYTFNKKNLDGSGSASHSMGAVYVGHLSFSPDGTRIGFCTWDGSNFQIAVIWADFSSYWMVTNGTRHVRYPRWSQTNDRFIYCSAEDGSGDYQLAYLNTDFYSGNTSAPNLLTHEPWAHFLEDVSPDGYQLMYDAIPPTTGNRDIYYYDLYYETSTRVTYNPATDTWGRFLRPTTASGTITGY